jgi:hypothetical protein
MAFCELGHVYVIHTTLSRPPKQKITVCICADQNLFFWINSKPNRNGIGQLPLVSADHPSLTRDCHLDCSRVTTFSGQELASAQPRGSISPALALRIVRFLEDRPPKTLTPRNLALAIRNLSGLFQRQ